MALDHRSTNSILPTGLPRRSHDYQPLRCHRRLQTSSEQMWALVLVSASVLASVSVSVSVLASASVAASASALELELASALALELASRLVSAWVLGFRRFPNMVP